RLELAELPADRLLHFTEFLRVDDGQHLAVEMGPDSFEVALVESIQQRAGKTAAGFHARGFGLSRHRIRVRAGRRVRLLRGRRRLARADCKRGKGGDQGRGEQLAMHGESPSWFAASSRALEVEHRRGYTVAFDHVYQLP